MIDASKILAHLPIGLRDPLLMCYQEIISNYLEHRWEPSELNGGKFCEIVYTILDGYIKGSYASNPAKPKSLQAACVALENTTPNPSRIGDRSVRILIPRALPVLYEIRNNRGVGHVGGDVDPNFMDASLVCNMAAWIFAELVRVFHNISTKEAQSIVDTLVERKHSLIWEIDDIRRVLDSDMKIGDQVLLLLHTKPGWATESDLFKWVEYSGESLFRNRILIPYHKIRLIEYDSSKRRVKISPKGVKEVEDRIIKVKS
jgi:hypothetical protein